MQFQNKIKRGFPIAITIFSPPNIFNSVTLGFTRCVWIDSVNTNLQHYFVRQPTVFSHLIYSEPWPTSCLLYSSSLPVLFTVWEWWPPRHWSPWLPRQSMWTSSSIWRPGCPAHRSAAVTTGFTGNCCTLKLCWTELSAKTGESLNSAWFIDQTLQALTCWLVLSLQWACSRASCSGERRGGIGVACHRYSALPVGESSICYRCGVTEKILLRDFSLHALWCSHTWASHTQAGASGVWYRCDVFLNTHYGWCCHVFGVYC